MFQAIYNQRIFTNQTGFVVEIKLIADIITPVKEKVS